MCSCFVAEWRRLDFLRKNAARLVYIAFSISSPPLYTFFFRGELWLKCLARRPGPPAFRLSGFDSSSSELLDSVDFLLSLKKAFQLEEPKLLIFTLGTIIIFCFRLSCVRLNKKNFHSILRELFFPNNWDWNAKKCVFLFRIVWDTSGRFNLSSRIFVAYIKRVK